MGRGTNNWLIKRKGKKEREHASLVGHLQERQERETGKAQAPHAWITRKTKNGDGPNGYQYTGTGEWGKEDS